MSPGFSHCFCSGFWVLFLKIRDFRFPSKCGLVVQFSFSFKQLDLQMTLQNKVDPQGIYKTNKYIEKINKKNNNNKIQQLLFILVT